jgi:hypothetical protein
LRSGWKVQVSLYGTWPKHQRHKTMQSGWGSEEDTKTQARPQGWLRDPNLTNSQSPARDRRRPHDGPPTVVSSCCFPFHEAFGTRTIGQTLRSGSCPPQKKRMNNIWPDQDPDGSECCPPSKSDMVRLVRFARSCFGTASQNIIVAQFAALLYRRTEPRRRAHKKVATALIARTKSTVQKYSVTKFTSRILIYFNRSS